MKRLMVYSHDTSGYGNIQRMLAICEHLIHSDPNLSVLVMSGSPMMHYFRIPKRLDYIKLPAFRRTVTENNPMNAHEGEEREIVQLRTDLILSALTHFKPDVFLVDRRPYGVKNELEEVLTCMNVRFPGTKQVLLLGDILDTPETTAEVWEMGRSHRAIRFFYDLVLLTGSPEMYDASEKYQFPAVISRKIRFCLDLCALAQVTQSIASVLHKDLGITMAKVNHDFVGHISMDGSNQRDAALVNT